MNYSPLEAIALIMQKLDYYLLAHWLNLVMRFNLLKISIISTSYVRMGHLMAAAAK